jgi:hypothetical protein
MTNGDGSQQHVGNWAMMVNGMMMTDSTAVTDDARTDGSTTNDTYGSTKLATGNGGPRRRGRQQR